MLAAYPTDVAWLNEHGRLSLAQGKKESAKETFADVLALDPENATATQGNSRTVGCRRWGIA